MSTSRSFKFALPLICASLKISLDDLNAGSVRTMCCIFIQCLAKVVSTPVSLTNLLKLFLWFINYAFIVNILLFL